MSNLVWNGWLWHYGDGKLMGGFAAGERAEQVPPAAAWACQVTPHAGALVEITDGEANGQWELVRGFEGRNVVHLSGFGEMWLGNLGDANYGLLPILPAVPDGCTREQVLGLILNPSQQMISLGGGSWVDDMRLYLRLSLYWQSDIPALKLAIQRYEALLAWWKANEVKHAQR